MIHLKPLRDEDYAAALVIRLEKAEAARTGLSVSEVRPIVARHVGLAVGTLENIRRRRIKAIKAHVYRTLLAAADRWLCAEIAKLEHERAVIAAQAGHSSTRDLAEVDAHIAAARAALGAEARR
ncbi:hypothetical protein J2X65_003179 [Ancylobacter sp. 3268]|uniref:hypothetical protein n=1 Tax=Ancylobacter sp. 3268 TaxID=2817752 RepID=UPI0028554FD3|nr:hypothetical protein [Ancylobacter sp. 3268]MDR6953816.1 hypothetical protein [Ancylobacter sp. 3268]